MNGQTEAMPADPTLKIARLVQERGWNQEDLARNANVSRHTARQILHANGAGRRLRNTTVRACASALGFSVADLHALPLQELLRLKPAPEVLVAEETARRRYERATQPELVAWIGRNPQRASRLDAAEMDELLSLQGTGGHLTNFGVERFVECIERRRRLHAQVDIVAGTEYLDMLEKLLTLMCDKVQPYRERT